MRRIYTPPAEVDRAVQESCSDRVKEFHAGAEIHPQSIQTRTVGGRPSESCIIDPKGGTEEFDIWVRSESLIMRFLLAYPNISVFRWVFEPILDTIKLP
jgi:hypothetical protein